MTGQWITAALFSIGLCSVAMAGNIDSGAVVGGAIGGGTGAAVGSAVGGRDGAIIGGAIGGAAGAAIGSSPTHTERVEVKEKVVVREAEGGPPGHHRGKKKGWYKHHDD